MEEIKKEDKVTMTTVTDKVMTMMKPDGTKVPVGAKVTETHYESGRKDCHVQLGTGISG